MTDQTQADPAAAPASAQDNQAAIQALAATLGTSMQQLARKTEADNVAILAFTVMLASMPETAQLKPERLAAVLGAVAKGQPVEFQQNVATFITGIINIGRELPHALATAEAAYRADQAKAEGGAPKPN